MSKSIPLVLDVDGTLIQNDLTHELFLKGISLYPFKIFTFLYLALTSRPKMKALLIDLVGDDIYAADLPYNDAVISRAQAAKDAGREVILCSGSQEKLIKQIENNFDWLDGSFGTTPTHNLTSKNKAAFLTSRYPDGFDYFGNSTQDYEVWKAARKGHAINPPRATEKIRSLSGEPIEIVEPKRSEIGAVFKALRLHQWAKNVLIFLVPTLVIERLTALDIPNLIFGFIAMGLLASGTYIFNDLLDIQADRQHHSKRKRPFASGRLSIPTGVIAMGLCLVAAVLISLPLPPLFQTILFCYFAVTLTYSAVLKRVAILDVLVLAFLFMIRVAAGAAIVSELLSPWLVSFILTFFLSLSLAKRYTELVKIEGLGKTAASGRGYTVADKPLVLGFGMMATAMTIISFILYGVIAEQPVLSSHSSVLIVGSILVYWIMRMWLYAHRGDLHDDPVLFAVKDKLSIALGAAIFAVVLVTQLDLL